MESKTTNDLIDEFWEWFRQDELKYRRIFDDKEADLIDDILNKLVELQDGLAVEFEKTKDIYIMTISADGVEEYFEIVQNIINKAPIINNWKFIAFRQPYTSEVVQRFGMTVDGYSLDPKKIMFLPIVEDDKLYIQIFSTEINEETKGIIGYGCLMLLDNIIGEYACVKQVNGYEYYNLEEATEFKNELKPLTEIKEYLDTYYQNK